MKTSQIKKIKINELRTVISSCIVSQKDALSKLLGEPLKHRLLKVRQIDVLLLGDIIPTLAYQEVCAAYVKCEGDVRIDFIFFLPAEQAKYLAGYLLRKSTKRFDVIEKSSIAEAGSILAGTFLNALCKATNARVKPSVPGLALDVLKALLETPVSEMASTTDSVVVADFELYAVKSRIMIRAIILIDPQGARKLLTKAEGAVA